MTDPKNAEDGRERSGPLWGGRFREGMAPEMEALNRSLDVDFRLWRHDVRGSRAWIRALGGAEVVTAGERDRILDGLDRVSRRLDSADPEDFPDEDIHSLVERLLFEEVGEVAGKLHTGRSRNDQIATDLRLWGMETTEELDGSVTALGRSLQGLAHRSLEVVLPGYTHLQPAQPIRGAHWALSHLWPLLRDRERIRRAGTEAAVLPLGSGALAGCPFPVDREGIREELGFQRISENSLDAVSDRDWLATLLFSGALLGVHLSRLAEDLVLFSSREFGFLRLGDAHTTGSSIMPQKRNPDVAELVRGKAGRLLGNLQALLSLLKGLPTGYNRDLQEDKPPAFDTVGTLRLVLPALSGAVEGAEFDPRAAREALSPELLATDLAEYLVREGVPFRIAHEVVGGLVLQAEEEGVELPDLPPESFQEAHPAFPSDLSALFDWNRSTDSRAVAGGTARSSVEAQLEEAESRLAG